MKRFNENVQTVQFLALLQKIRRVVHYCVFQGRSSMSDFKWRHFRGEMILGCVRWYCKYGISYRDLEEMMLERGLAVDHTTLYRWGSALRAGNGNACGGIGNLPWATVGAWMKPTSK